MKRGTAHETIEFIRLSAVDPTSIVALMNDTRVRRQLPLARGRFDLEACARFVERKERMWEEFGFGPWGFVREGRFIGWGGLQPEGDDADIGLVLHPDGWGLGRQIYDRVLAFAFDQLGLESVIALLPPTRRRGGGLVRMGFVPDGEIDVDGERFVRFRLHSPGGGGSQVRVRAVAPRAGAGVRLGVRGEDRRLRRSMMRGGSTNEDP